MRKCSKRQATPLRSLSKKKKANLFPSEAEIKRTLPAFRKISKKYLPTVPADNGPSWKKLTDEQWWQKIVDQVIIVGSSAPFGRLGREPALREEISYVLLKNAGMKKREQMIHRFLRKLGVRYSSATAARCTKTKALLKNFKTISSCPGGPKGFFASVAAIEGDLAKVQILSRSLSYVKNKGARDFLMDVGLVEDTIAFDVRVLGVLKHLGINCDSRLIGTSQRYARLEEKILKHICRPLGISGKQFDRMIYQNGPEIVKSF